MLVWHLLLVVYSSHRLHETFSEREGGYISIDDVKIENVDVGEVLDFYSGFGDTSIIQSVSFVGGVGELIYEDNVKVPLVSGLISELIVSDLIELFNNTKEKK